MAEVEKTNILGFVDKRRVAGDTTLRAATPLNYVDVGKMRTRLAAISGTTYTTAVLNQMTTNDMVFAIRTNDDAASL